LRRGQIAVTSKLHQVDQTKASRWVGLRRHWAYPVSRDRRRVFVVMNVGCTDRKLRLQGGPRGGAWDLQVLDIRLRLGPSLMPAQEVQRISQVVEILHYNEAFESRLELFVSSCLHLSQFVLVLLIQYALSDQQHYRLEHTSRRICYFRRLLHRILKCLVLRQSLYQLVYPGLEHLVVARLLVL
jgi:hypothetical protein